jgi:hypothetical protein
MCADRRLEIGAIRVAILKDREEYGSVSVQLQSAGRDIATETASQRSMFRNLEGRQSKQVKVEHRLGLRPDSGPK